MFEKKLSDQFLKKLESIQTGSLVVHTPDGHTHAYEGAQKGAKAVIHIHDWRIVGNLLARGDVGFAEDYRDGFWDTPDMESLTTLALQNDTALHSFIFGSRIFQILGLLSSLSHRNTLKGSKRNIHAHYDLGNAFYSLWLDPSMTYSSALFSHPTEPLLSAQMNKYDRMIDGLSSRSGSLLEIGCGWGGFAERASDKADYAIKAITLSPAQHAFAKNRLGQTASVAIEDYRHQSGQFDHIVSIEMFEAVGAEYWRLYFDKLKSLLAPRGKAMIQTITIAESCFESYRKSPDIIRTHIFPGGLLPSPERFESAARRSGLAIQNRFDFGSDYARTLEIWLDTFESRLSSVRALGFDEKFIRLWRFYLASCISGFRTGRTNVMQVAVSHAN